MRGCKYTDDVLLKALALFSAGKRAKQVAKEMDVPLSTAEKWQRRWNKYGFQLQPDGERINLAELSAEYKKNFVNRSWDIINKAQQVLERRMERVIEHEAEIDELIGEVMSDSDVKGKERDALIAKMRAIKVDDVSKIAVVLGTLYDKQALANKEPTEVVEGNLQVKKFEDFSD